MRSIIARKRELCICHIDMRSGKTFPVFSGFCKIYENHPWKRIFVGRDEISREESSLEEDFYWQTICATIGTTAGVTMAGISARLFGATAGLSGLLISSLGRIWMLPCRYPLRWMRWCVRTRQSQEESCFMQGIGGSFGVVLCVPITVVIASLLLRAPLKNKPDQ